MLYTGQITDSSGQPVPGASLTFLNDAGQYITAIPVSAFGNYSIDTSFDDGLFVPGIIAVFSAPGFYDYKLTAQTLPQTFSVQLTKKINAAAMLGLGAVAAVLIFDVNRKQKVSGVKSFMSNLPPWGKGLAVVGGLGLVYYFLLKGKNQGGQLPQQADQQLQQLAQQGITPTMSSAEFEGLASKIVVAVDDCGTDENAIYSAFGYLQNQADLMQLIKTYGVRSYKGCFEGSYFGNVQHNLSETLTGELSESELSTLNNILLQEGINYKF